MSQEIKTLHDNSTWTLIPKPGHANVIANKWIYRIKHKADGTIYRYKARLVAKGFT